MEILARIDWAIVNRYLAIEYSGRLPLLSYTPRGWEIEKDTYSSELLMILKAIADRKSNAEDVSFLKDKNRSLIFLLLDKIASSKDPTYIYVLRQWERIEFKKVRQRIQQVIQAIHQ
jgi:hypothetical protein